MRDLKGQKSLSILKKNWTVAELQVTYRPKNKTGVKVTCSNEAYQVFRQMWDKSLINIQEQFCALYLNQANEVIGFRLISTGKVTSNTVDVQLMFACALISRASVIMLAHNHPSGNLKPSAEDKRLTWQLKELARKFDFRIIDHLVITQDYYTSFADEGIIFKAD